MTFNFTFDPSYRSDAETFRGYANSGALMDAAYASTATSRRRLLTFHPLPVKLTTLGKALALEQAVRRSE